MAEGNNLDKRNSDSDESPQANETRREMIPVARVTNHAGVTLRQVTVRAGSRVLLENVDADFRPQEITLIVGPSGVGKSVLTRAMAGILDERNEGLELTGEILINGQPAKNGQAGVVFQAFALFDELSPLGNLEFAHASGGDHANPIPNADLLNDLRVPLHVPTSRLSGGQRQRLAIARTLAYNPPVILYDEPTSGLDPLTAEQVAQLIRQTNQHYGKTSVVVTHDYQSLMPIADRIYLLDPIKKRLVDVPRDQWSGLHDELSPMASTTVKQSEVTVRPIVGAILKDNLFKFFETTTNAVVFSFIGLLSLIPFWKTPRWGMRFFAHFSSLVFGPTAWLYLAAAGVIAGFVSTYFTFQFLPYSAFTEPLLVEDLLTALGFALYRIVVPILACILVAARCGAAVTADVGGREFGNQIDALRTFSAEPRYYLLTPILWAFLIGTPLLSFIAFEASRWTSLITFTLADPNRGPDYWHFYFYRGLFEPGQFFFRGFGWLIVKLLVCGLGTALISYYRGVASKYSTSDVSRSVTATILWATLFVLVVHFVFALYEYRGSVPQTG